MSSDDFNFKNHPRLRPLKSPLYLSSVCLLTCFLTCVSSAILKLGPKSSFVFLLFFFSGPTQIRCWGNVEWAHDYDMYELRARTSAGALFVHLTSESSTVKHKLMQD